MRRYASAKPRGGEDAEASDVGESASICVLLRVGDGVLVAERLGSEFAGAGLGEPRAEVWTAGDLRDCGCCRLLFVEGPERGDLLPFFTSGVALKAVAGCFPFTGVDLEVAPAPGRAGFLAGLGLGAKEVFRLSVKKSGRRWRCGGGRRPANNGLSRFAIDVRDGLGLRDSGSALFADMAH